MYTISYDTRCTKCGRTSSCWFPSELNLKLVNGTSGIYCRNDRRKHSFCDVEGNKPAEVVYKENCMLKLNKSYTVRWDEEWTQGIFVGFGNNTDQYRFYMPKHNRGVILEQEHIRVNELKEIIKKVRHGRIQKKNINK